MADADFTVASKIQPPQFDPLKTAGGMMALQQGMLANRLLGLNLAGKQALGGIIGQNTDPTTGETDWQKVSAAASQSPEAAILLPDIQKQVLDRQLAQVQLQRENLGLSNDQWKKVGAEAMALLGQRDPDGKPAALTKDAVTKAMSSGLIGSGMFSDQNAVKRLTGFVTSLPDDPDGIRAALKNVAIMSNPTAETVGLVNGNPETINTGSQIIQQQRSALTGEAPTVQATANVTRSPSEKAQLVPTWNPVTHQYENRPSGEIIGDMAPGAVPGQKGPVVVKGAPALGETATAESNVQQAQQLQQDAAGAPDRIGILQNMRDAAKNFTSGTASQQLYSVNAWITQLSKLLGKAPPPQQQSLAAAQEEFRKLSIQYAAQQGSAVGLSGSDTRAGYAQHANPNEGMTLPGIDRMIAINLGMEQSREAKFKAWQAYQKANGGSAASYSQFLNEWNDVYDPRAFQYINMNTADQKAMRAQFKTDGDRKKFETALRFAQKLTE